MALPALNKNLSIPEIRKGDKIKAAFLNALLALGLQSRLTVVWPLQLLSQSVANGTFLGFDISTVVFPTLLTQTGGVAGGDKTDCSYTYTVKRLDGTQILSDATPLNSDLRFSGVEYSAGTFGIGGLKKNLTDYWFVTLDEYWTEKQLYLSDTSYKVNADAASGYLELTENATPVVKQISLDLTSDPIININKTSSNQIQLNGATPQIDMKLDSTHYITLDGSTPKMTLYGGTAGYTLFLDCNGGEINMTNGSETVDAKLSDLNGGATAKFQDITYVTDVSWDGTDLKQTKKTVRVLAETPGSDTTTTVDSTVGCS